MHELSDSVVEAARGGDRGAQTAVLRRYARPLHGLVYRLAPAGADVEDLSQALLAHLLEVLPRYRLGGSATLTTWVFTVAHRWLIDTQRKRHLALAPLEHAAEVPDAAPSAEADVARAQARAALEAAIAALPVAQRRVFVLAVKHEQPLEAIAEAEGLPLGTVKSRLARARADVVARLSTHPDARPGAPHAHP